MNLDTLLNQQWYGVPSEYWLGGGAVMLIGMAAIALVARHQRHRVANEVQDLTARPERDDGPGHALRIDPPDMGGTLMGFVSLWRHERKAKRLARKGYVKWYKIGARRRRPKWVKPEPDGAGVPEYYDSDDDVTYVFPPNALVTDARSGAYVAEHRVNESEPINLRDPAMPPLDADRFEEVINLEAESDAPGFFDRLNLDQSTVMWGVIILAFVAFAAYRELGGAA